MDFHHELEQCLVRFPSLGGIIFVDPDGEAIVYKTTSFDNYEIRLAGAKMPILTNPLQEANVVDEPKTIEMQCDGHYYLYVRLVQQYSLTAVGEGFTEKHNVRNHMINLAKKFNREIL